MAIIDGLFDLCHVGEHHAFANFAIAIQRQVVEAEDDILGRNNDRLAVGRRQDVVGRHHQDAGFQLGLKAQRHVHGHLVTIEVSVERGADQRVQLDGLALDQFRLERLDAETVQRRRTVQQNRVLTDDLVQDIPDFRLFLFDQLLGRFHGASEALGVETRIDERLEQFQRHLLRQATLVQLQAWANHDDRTAGIVDALAEQVLTEAALLAFQHVGQRLQRALVGARDRTAATAIVEQGVNGFLQHPLFVPDDDVRRAKFHQALQAVVPVDHAAIEVVEVGGRKAAAIQRDQRAQIRWNDRDHVQDHPFRLGARCQEGIDDFQPLGQFLGFQFGRGLSQLFAKRLGQNRQVQRLQQFADGLGTDHGGERVLAKLVLLVHVFFFGEQLTRLQLGQARLDDDIAFEVEHALHIFQRHVEQRGDAGRQRLQEPDVRDRRSQVDVAHPLAAHARQRHFNAALLTGDAAILDALVLAAKALIVLRWAEDTGTEQAVPLRLEGPVVDGFRLLDLT